MPVRRSLSAYIKSLLCFAALLALAPAKGWSSEVDEEGEDIILPCLAPSEYCSQTINTVRAEFFDNVQLNPETVQRIIEKGQDGRKRIQNTKEFPYSAQVYFVVTFPGSPTGTCEIGSGTFIHPEVILTAGHVVYSHKYGGIYKTIKCTAAQNEAIVPFSIPSVKGIKVSEAYLNNFSVKENDYALVFINRPVGKETGNLGIAVVSDNKLNEVPVTIAGYPADKMNLGIARPTMWGMEGNLYQILCEYLHYDIDTYGGQSGSGIFYKGKKDNYYLVGIHAYGVDTDIEHNHGPRLTRKKAEEIRNWIRQFKSNALKFDNEVIIAKLIQEANKQFLDVQVKLLPGQESLPREILAEARKGSKEAQYEIGLRYAEGQGIKQSDKDALYWIRTAAENDCIEAQIKLGMMYKYGQGAEKNKEDAFMWTEQAAKAENKKAQFNLSVLYYDDQGMGDSAKAFKWCQRSAEQNYPEAQHRLGWMYEKGIGIGKDYAKAIEWYSKAEKQDYAPARFSLGEMYLKGTGVIQDPIQAFKWVRKAAEEGYPEAQYRLGLMYSQGEGVTKNEREAFQWYHTSAEQGCILAYYPLGLMYEEGNGVAKNDEEAARWYQETLNENCPEANLAKASYHLGMFFYKGDGITQDYAKAQKLLDDALFNGIDSIEIRGALGTICTKDIRYQIKKPTMEVIQKQVTGSLDLSALGTIETKEIRSLCYALECNYALTKLNLSNNHIEDEGVKVLANNTTLTIMVLRFNKIGNEGAAAISKALETNTTLTSLKLEGNQIGNSGAEAISRALETNTTLTSLELEGNQIGKDKVGYIKALSARNKITNDTMLISLNLRKEEIKDEGAIVISRALETNTTLTSLDLGKNQIGDAGAEAIGKALETNTTLTSLDLGKNQIGDAGAEAIGRSLKTNTTLTSLYLDSNLIKITGVEALGKALETNATLTSLELRKNQIEKKMIGYIKGLLFRNKINNTILISLYLDDELLGDAGVEPLCKALATNTTLISLELGWNKIGNTGAEAISKALTTNTTLTSLKLMGNNIGSVGVEALGKALETNTTLISLELECKIDVEMIDYIETLLDKNKK